MGWWSNGEAVIWGVHVEVGVKEAGKGRDAILRMVDGSDIA
jgi:gamma-glutamyl:cysteine ligase YbdK (ATP-grasp superfamily)